MSYYSNWIKCKNWYKRWLIHLIKLKTAIIKVKNAPGNALMEMEMLISATTVVVKPELKLEHMLCWWKYNYKILFTVAALHQWACAEHIQNTCLLPLRF